MCFLYHITVPMKCNVKELALLSDQPCVIEGRLNYKKVYNGSYRNQAVFKERWFRLINNYLFYFKISEMGKFDTKNPAGVFVMENSSIQMEHGQSISFSFSISFIDEPEKRHVFTARCEDNVVQWVMKLRNCTYEYLRNQLHALQSKIFSITGKDPLLLVPRNDGACLWAPSAEGSTTSACSVNKSSFSCHLHTNSLFTLERSKSDVQAYQNLRNEFNAKATFYIEDPVQNDKKDTAYSLEKSKTSAVYLPSTNTVDMKIFDNRPTYSRAAPSPPVRTKLSPGNRRALMSHEVKAFTEQGKYLGQMGILDIAPVPPKRKISPKHSVNAVPSDLNKSENSNDMSQDNSEDLIKF